MPHSRSLCLILPSKPRTQWVIECDSTLVAGVASLAGRSWTNKRHHLHTYQKFCKLREVVLLAPSVYDLLSFWMHLASFLSAPGSVMNYFSSVKSWVESIAWPKPEFQAYQIKVMKRGIFKNSLHRVKKAPPLTPTEFSNVISFLLGFFLLHR